MTQDTKREAVGHTVDICDRLRGIYRIPITDGLGAVGSGLEPDNPNEFVRGFPTSPIKLEAADIIEQMLSALHMVSGLDVHHEVLCAVDAAISKAEGRAS